MRLCPYFRVTAHFSATSIHRDSYKNVMARRWTVGKQGASSPLTLMMHNKRAGNMYFSMGNNKTR
ncbi:hypothetical protein NC651_024224 [Populus alba x Populus x berolinensis]|nr:hypothetical protein NC651_024224 [Populus alba x Populus x berolinensis]